MKAKELISPKSDAFEELQSIVSCKNFLKYSPHLTQFCHTGILEVYHALYNKWTPKWQYFSYVGMFTRSQLAVMDFSKGISLEQATTGQGDKCFNVTFSKVTRQWSAKGIKENNDISICIEWWKKPLNQLQKLESLMTKIKLLLYRTKNQDLESEFSFFNCIYFLHI